MIPGAEPSAADLNRYERDALLSELIRMTGHQRGLDVTEVDESTTIETVTDAVAGRLRGLPGGLRPATSGAERHRIRRDFNAVVLRQLSGWWHDAGPDRLPDPPKFPFFCECSTPGCVQDVTLSATEYTTLASAGAVTARG